MQATEAYIGSEQWPHVHVPEKRSREMNNIPSRFLRSFHRRAYRYLGNAHRETREDELRKSELHQRLMESLQQLSPSLRKAFELRELHDLTTSEAAHILGLADGTVKGQLSRTRTTKVTYAEGPRSKARSAMTNSSMPVLTRE